MIVYGPPATDSPAAREALKVILPAPRSAARKPLSVVVSAGSSDPYTFDLSSAVTDAAFLVIVSVPGVTVRS